MRLAIVSDIHGNLPALEAVIADLERQKPDLIVNLGDLVSGPLWPKETLSRLQALNWPTVQGNCDRVVSNEKPEVMSKNDRFAYEHLDAAARGWLAALPVTIDVAADILALHGTPASDETYLLEAPEKKRPLKPFEVEMLLGPVKERLVLCGHSHRPRLVQTPSGRLVINPGSVGRSDAGAPHARYAIVTRAQGSFSAQHIAVPYDFESAVRKAEAEGRKKFAAGLRDGVMR